MAKKSKLKIIPLGGLNEIGKNMTVFSYGNDMIIVDCGMAFPDEEMFGIDIVIPDFSFVVKNSDKIRGVVLTHGHEDHIGGLAYLLKEINVPIYGTNLTLGLVQNKLKEHNLLSTTKLNRVMPGDTVSISGSFKVEFIRTNHSIPDAVALAIHTPIGVVLHTGDFKIDTTPIQGEMIDLTRIGELGKAGVLALMSDSTNAERKGFTMSERIVGSTLESVFKSTKSRIIVATFASNVHRIQQIINAAANNNRKIAVSGRSMLNLLEVATELGYMKIPANTLIDIDDINKYKPHQLTIITTGSQGEPMSALYRMAYSDHKKVDIVKGDLVIISANPIPGNEKLVSNVVNELYKKGADVFNDPACVHVSGHACQEELKMILALAKPKYFIPVHGEYKHLKTHADLALLMGMKSKDIFLMDIGKVLEISKDSAKCTETVQAGLVMVDGLGVGDVGNIVLRDRKHLAEDGLIIVVVTISAQTGTVVAGPDIISRGFVYVRESENLMDDIKTISRMSLDSFEQNHIRDWTTLKNGMKSKISEYLYRETKRKPMILPVIMEV